MNLKTLLATLTMSIGLGLTSLASFAGADGGEIICILDCDGNIFCYRKLPMDPPPPLEPICVPDPGDPGSKGNQ